MGPNLIIKENAMPSDNLTSDTCRAKTTDTAATGAAPATTSRVQRWEGSNILVGGEPAAAQDSGLQLVTEQGHADTAGRAAEAMGSKGAGMQGGQTGAAKSRKRSAEASSAQPAAKRSVWNIQAFAGSMAGSEGQQHSPCETANVAGLEGGSHSSEDGQEVAKGGRASRSSFRTAKRRRCERSEEAEHA